MSIILDSSGTKREVTDVTNDIKRINTQLYLTIKRLHTEVFDIVWNNKEFTASEIVNSMGSDAIALFKLSSGLQQLLKATDPNYEVLLPPKEFTIDVSGVIINE